MSFYTYLPSSQGHFTHDSGSSATAVLSETVSSWGLGFLDSPEENCIATKPL